MKRDERVDHFIAKAQPFARPLLEHLREFIHRTIPDAEEAIKWGVPHFTYKGKNVAGMNAFKAHCALAFHERGGSPGQYIKFAEASELPDAGMLAGKLKAACAEIDSGELKTGQRIRSRTKAEIPVPQDFAAALRNNPAAQAVFEGFAPSHRREYLEWITGAKQDATREKRLNQAIEWIAEGKHRNWKYEKR